MGRRHSHGQQLPRASQQSSGAQGVHKAELSPGEPGRDRPRRPRPARAARTPPAAAPRARAPRPARPAHRQGAAPGRGRRQTTRCRTRCRLHIGGGGTAASLLLAVLREAVQPAVTAFPVPAAAHPLTVTVVRALLRGRRVSRAAGGPKPRVPAQQIQLALQRGALLLPRPAKAGAGAGRSARALRCHRHASQRMRHAHSPP